MKKIIVLAVLAACLVPIQVMAGKNCYSKPEAEADQGIRIHSELMVIGLNCQHIGQRYGQDLYGDYRKFTTVHAKLFAKYETTLMDFYKKNGIQNPESNLNDLRTRYANKISYDAAKMRPDIFCSKYAPRIRKAKAMKTDDIHKWAAMIFPAHPVSYPLCSG